MESIAVKRVKDMWKLQGFAELGRDIQNFTVNIKSILKMPMTTLSGSFT